jgi:hypothetical protein
MDNRFKMQLVMAGILLCLTPLFSQKKPATADTTQSAPHISQRDVKLFIDKIEVKGQLEKPQAIFFLPGQTPDIDDIQIERSFLKEIFRPVEKRITYETKYSKNRSKKTIKNRAADSLAKLKSVPFHF